MAPTPPPPPDLASIGEHVPAIQKARMREKEGGEPITLSQPETHIQRQAALHDSLPRLLGDGET